MNYIELIRRENARSRETHPNSGLRIHLNISWFGFGEGLKTSPPRFSDLSKQKPRLYHFKKDLIVCGKKGACLPYGISFLRGSWESFLKLFGIFFLFWLIRSVVFSYDIAFALNDFLFGEMFKRVFSGFWMNGKSKRLKCVVDWGSKINFWRYFLTFHGEI